MKSLLRYKSSAVYSTILVVWICVLISQISSLKDIIDQLPNNLLMLTAVLYCLALVTYFWLNGIKDIVYTFRYWISSRSFSVTNDSQKKKKLDSVAVLYTTCNDFDEASLEKSMQNLVHKNKGEIKLFILDDSKDKAYKSRVNSFAKKYKITKIKVIRRKDRSGFKAGNVNNWLFKHASEKFKYFILLDSDEIVPRGFIKNCLKYMLSDVAVVQANHIANREQTQFMKLYSPGVESHWITYQSVKNKYGFLSLLGHGALIRTEIAKDIGGFPHVVAEDLAFSIKLAEKGYRVAFAPDVICSELYPHHYFAFKKRHAKWTMGNMEFIQKFSNLFLSKKLKWFEKLDILLFVYNLPLTLAFVSFFVLHFLVFPLAGIQVRYPASMMWITIAALVAPALNDIIYLIQKRRTLWVIWYIIHCVLLFGSMYFLSFYSALRAVGGKAVFLVTPKEAQKFSLTQSLHLNAPEIIFGTILLVVSSALSSITTVFLIAFPSIASIYLGLLSKKVKKQQRTVQLYI